MDFQWAGLPFVLGHHYRECHMWFYAHCVLLIVYTVAPHLKFLQIVLLLTPKSLGNFLPSFSVYPACLLILYLDLIK